MHDLMHELAGKVSSNVCATIDGLKPEAIQPSVCHLSIITTAFDTDKHGSFPNEKFDKILRKVGPLPKLRTLMLFGRRSTSLPVFSYFVQGGKMFEVSKNFQDMF
jgi:hypothetical protein